MSGQREVRQACGAPVTAVTGPDLYSSLWMQLHSVQFLLLAAACSTSHKENLKLCS